MPGQYDKELGFIGAPGRNTCIRWAWLQASFRPAQQVCALRSLLRHRDSLVKTASTYAQRIQKALDQMNLQLHHVISDITGVSGVTILDAILDGERDPLKLASLRDYRIKATEETVALVASGRLPSRTSLHSASEPRRMPVSPQAHRRV